MKPSSDITGLYRSFPAYLWVEDEETRTYLETAWNGEARIKIYVGGGHTHLAAVVSAARNDWATHVFGFRDRDFGASNRARWTDTAVTILTSDAVELENLLLDAKAIAACEVNTSGLSDVQIEQQMLNLAQPLTWWMSCRRTISEMRDAVTEEFIDLGKPCQCHGSARRARGRVSRDARERRVEARVFRKGDPPRADAPDLDATEASGS